MNLFSSIKSILNPPPPDPRRFAVDAAPFNWFGEASVSTVRKSGAILVNKETQTYEFGHTGIEIDPNLTALDIAGLQKRGLDPSNPAYAKCKEYFSKMPFCTKEDLAANSSSDDFEGIKPHTAKDVLAAFRAFLVDKPTF